MKRIRNFRTGDRAEKLGVFLLQAFCAVAEIPRQEDFGLVDAVATLLRRDGVYLHAEDSFSVQMKSRTERKIEYLGPKFEAIINQDLPLLVAQVDLTQASVELHTLGIALAHVNINDAKGLVVHLQPDASCGFGLIGDVLHVPLRKPILKWTTGDTENHEFTDLAYSVLKAWLSIERWNRRYRRAGIARQVDWETNVVPTERGESQIWQPTRSREILGEIAPLVRLLTLHGMDHAELRAPIRAILTFLREHGVEADPEGIHRIALQQSDSEDRLKKALDENPEADVAVTFCIAEARPDYLNFWQYSRNRKGTGNGIRHAGSLQALREQGFEAKVDIDGDQTKIIIGLSGDWLAKHHLEEATKSDVARMPDPGQEGIQVLLLRNAALQ